MASSVPKLIFLTGAPESQSLSWQDHDLLDDFLPALKNCLAGTFYSSTESHVASGPIGPTWRVLDRIHPDPPAAFSKPRQAASAEPERPPRIDENASFFTATNHSYDSTDREASSLFVSSAETDEELLSQFYEQSFALHKNVPSSQLPGPEVFTLQSINSSVDGTSSFTTTTSESSSNRVESSIKKATRISEAPSGGHLSDIEDIPNAAYLHSITPQTMTVNLIVGIISIAPGRIITTRRNGQEMEIVELLVTDETKAGFGINFWLRPDESQGSAVQQDSSRRRLESLRPQDIILIRNVALSAFRGKVFGQSLRKNVTKLDLLYRNVVDADDEPGAYRPNDLQGEMLHPQIQKVKLVRDWVMRFVGPVANTPGP
ncbi:MAG: hypothetical protein M1819_005548 [Sarea resinae]|nr:MAG: hypothetical protein M1819_005548 [Sarea resinae]